MDAPKCRLCGKRHWLTEPCAVGAVSVASKPVAEVTAPVKRSAKPPFDRKAYQRQYLRKYMRTYLPKWRAKRAQAKRAKAGLR